MVNKDAFLPIQQFQSAESSMYCLLSAGATGMGRKPSSWVGFPLPAAKRLLTSTFPFLPAP